IDSDSDPEDVLFDSLQMLYEFQPITLTSAGASYTYIHHTSHPSLQPNLHPTPVKITLQTPDPEAANWSLHASSVWIASTQLALGIEFLQLDGHIERMRRTRPECQSGDRKLKVLELGAAAGLPSILIAKLHGASNRISVLATDYPDPKLIQTLSQNIERNGVEEHCYAAPYAWGSDPAPLFALGAPGKVESISGGFDMIIAADTLWNPDLHSIFIETIQQALRRDSEARVHLVAGLHTGRYTVSSFLCSVAGAGFRVVGVLEREVVSIDDAGKTDVTQTKIREWDVTRAEYEEEKDRRRWVIWIEL
ncbi:hypothetical protein P691DRAFT_609317, partial [Macrolepiota fuliginosa MF-IS2]